MYILLNIFNFRFQFHIKKKKIKLHLLLFNLQCKATILSKLTKSEKKLNSNKTKKTNYLN